MPVADGRPVSVDLFSGAGGMSLGFEQAGFDVLMALDNDPVHLATYAFNFPQTATKCEDAATLSADELHQSLQGAYSAIHSKPWDGVIDCLFGGPSCQGFSYIGRRDPDDHRNELVQHFARFVRDLRPRYFVMENVPGLLQPQNATLLAHLLTRFREAGYELVSDGPLVLDASEFGVPQFRRRVFLIGAAEGEQLPGPPLPSRDQQTVTVGEALDDLVNADDYEELLASDHVDLDYRIVEEGDQRASAYAASLRRFDQGDTAEWRRNWQPSQLTSSRRTRHTAEVVDRFAELEQGCEDPVSRLPRLDSTGHSPTLRAGTGRDHGSHTSPRPIHPRYDRVITVREAARLHSFPDWFRFHTTKWHGFRQVGNAVPPRLAAAVAASVTQALGVIPSRPKQVLDLGDPSLLRLSLIEAASEMGLDVSLLPIDSRRRKAS